MKRAPFAIIPAVLAILLCSCSLFDYSGVATKRHALVYGVTTYVASIAAGYYPNLSYPHLDAKDVAAMLEDQGYTVKSRWVDDLGYVYVDGVQGALISSDSSEAPSKSVIESDFASITDGIGADDEFLFYFSGHGMQDSSTEYIVPFGGLVYQYSDYYGDESTSITDAELGALLSTHIPTSRKIVVLDTCNSGGFIGNGLEVDITPGSTESGRIIIPTVNTLAAAISNYASFSSTSTSGVSPYNASVLSAAGADEYSYDDAGNMHGAMTWYLLETPASADLNSDGSVTVREAFSYVKAGIEEYWNKSYPSRAFTPHVSGGPVDYVLY